MSSGISNSSTTSFNLQNSVVLETVDDYLAPSQACINPLFQPPPSSAAASSSNNEKTPEYNNNNYENDDDDETSSNKVGTIVVPRRRRRRRRPTIQPPPQPQQQQQLEKSPDDDTTMIVSTFENSSNTFQKKTDNNNNNSNVVIQPKDVVKASIADCLACSGCVTTAETVLMEQQHSLSNLKKRLASTTTTTTTEENQPPPKMNTTTTTTTSCTTSSTRVCRILTISPNSWADLCRHWNLVEEKEENNYFYYSRFTTLLQQILSVHVVVDGNVPLQWTWIDEAQEFCHSYHQESSKQRQSVEDKETDTESMHPSVAIDSTQSLVYHPDGSTTIRVEEKGSTNKSNNHNHNNNAPLLPVISGSCPALVCLVEKTHPLLVSHLSKTMSPMSMIGMLLKDNHNNNNNNSNHNNTSLYQTISQPSQQNEEKSSQSFSSMIGDRTIRLEQHWAIMPCHDKKLEASRKDYYLTEKKEQCVDLVITTKECVEFIEEWIQMKTKKETNNNNTKKKKNHPPHSPNVVESVATYLESLPPSTVVTNVLEPKQLVTVLSNDVVSLQNDNALLIAPSSSSSSLQQFDNDKDDIMMMSQKQSQKQMAYASGGHANFIFQFAAKKLFDCDLDHVVWKPAATTQLSMNHNHTTTTVIQSARLSTRRRRNNNRHWYETKLYCDTNGCYSIHESEGSTTVLHFVIAHGMQTMQRALNLLLEEQQNNNNQHKHNNQHNPNYNIHYLEAMACPHGCVNGGGSVPVLRRSAASSNTTNIMSGTTLPTTNTTTSIRETPTETLTRVEKTIQHLQVPKPIPAVSSSLLSSTKACDTATTLPTPRRTKYHIVPSMQYAMGATAGVPVDKIQW